jgi:hypothetical protein
MVTEIDFVLVWRLLMLVLFVTLYSGNIIKPANRRQTI